MNIDRSIGTKNSTYLTYAVLGRYLGDGARCRFYDPRPGGVLVVEIDGARSNNTFRARVNVFSHQIRSQYIFFVCMIATKSCKRFLGKGGTGNWFYSSMYYMIMCPWPERKSNKKKDRSMR